MGKIHWNYLKNTKMEDCPVFGSLNENLYNERHIQNKTVEVTQ